MIQIRNGVFETNSSSVHSITMCSKSDYEKWKNGKMYYRDYAEELCDKQEIISRFKNRDEYKHIDWSVDWRSNSEIRNILHNNKFYTFDEFYDKFSNLYETFTETHTTDSGEAIYAFGYYGNDY